MPVGTGYNLSFPTPDALPDETVCRIFTLPADRIFLGAFMGALEYLTDPEHWQEVGSVSPEDSAQAIFDAIDAAYTLAEDGVCSAVVPAPYWDEDSGDDADDEAPAVEQPWYGEIVNEGVTWREQVGIWAVTAFIAVTATPAAAIAFLPFANRFVLAFKQHSAGAIVKVLIDGLEMATVDTYAPADGVINVPISLPAPTGLRAFDDDPPVLWVMMTDETNPAVTDPPSMQVIRKRLDATEVTPANLRWDAECDCVQQTPDNGATWVDSPTQDPRSSTIFQVPARGGDNPQCDSATQMQLRIKNMLDAVIVSSNLLQAINAVVAVVSIFFFEVGIVIEAIWAIVGAIFSVGTTTLDAALTDPVYADLLCILNCNIGSDGTVTAEQFANIKSEVDSKLETVAAFAINQALDSIGFVGLTNAGALGEVTGDCSTCECDCPPGLDWCETLVDPAVNYDGGFVTYGVDWSGFGEFSYNAPPGEGARWTPTQCANRGGVERATLLQIQRTLPTGHYTYLRVDWAVVFGTFTTDIRQMQALIDSSAAISTTTDEGDVTIHEADIDVTGTPLLQIVGVLDYINPCVGCTCEGFCRVVRIEVGGLGTKPDFS